MDQEPYTPFLKVKWNSFNEEPLAYDSRLPKEPSKSSFDQKALMKTASAPACIALIRTEYVGFPVIITAGGKLIVSLDNISWNSHSFKFGIWKSVMMKSIDTSRNNLRAAIPSAASTQ